MSIENRLAWMTLLVGASLATYGGVTNSGTALLSGGLAIGWAISQFAKLMED